MTRPFIGNPQLSSHYPSPEDMVKALAGAPRAVREVVARLWLSEGLPAAFLNSPAVYEDLRGWLATRLDIHPKEITLIGSARIGYSLAPPPDFGRPFGEGSDLDLSIVSIDLFKRVTTAFDSFSADYKSGDVSPRSPWERQLWSENLAFGLRNIPKGFFDPNKIPNFDRYPVAQQISQSMWETVKKLNATPGAPKVRRASTRVYCNWQSFIEKVSFNLMAALRK